MTKFNCNRCDQTFESYDSLKRHTSRVHKVHAMDLYIEHELNGVHPTCACGCNGLTKWTGHGFRDYLPGHVSRVKNNWGHNTTAAEKSAETRRQQYANGDREVWNKGLTCETDIRVAGYGKSISKTWSVEKRTKHATIMRQNRLNGTIPTRYGSASPNWQGGSSTISSMCSADSRLYKQWKFPILAQAGFKCEQCGSHLRLEVHHDVETMSDIIHKFIDKSTPNMTWEDKIAIVEQVIKYHLDNNVHGIVLCKECHANLHPKYNFS